MALGSPRFFHIITETTPCFSPLYSRAPLSLCTLKSHVSSFELPRKSAPQAAGEVTTTEPSLPPGPSIYKENRLKWSCSDLWSRPFPQALLDCPWDPTANEPAGPARGGRGQGGRAGGKWGGTWAEGQKEDDANLRTKFNRNQVSFNRHWCWCQRDTKQNKKKLLLCLYVI